MHPFLPLLFGQWHLFFSFDYKKEYMKTISNDECFVKPFKSFPILNEDTYAKVQLRWKWRHQRRTDTKSSEGSTWFRKIGGIDIHL